MVCPEAEWIARREALDTWMTAVRAGAIVGMDTEFMRRNTFFPQLALVQLAEGGRHALVDPLAFPLDDALAALDAENAPVCVMHSPGEDLEAMAPMLPNGPRNLFDTQLAAAYVGMGLGLSYRALVETVTGALLDKGETRSDWLQRPLTVSQRLYATLDVVHLEAVYDYLRVRLEERGRMAWLQEDCERLKRRAGERADPDQPQREFRGAADWPRERQALLRRILRWREATARQLDRPRPWLLEDAQAMSLVQEIPVDEQDLFARTRGQRALRGPQRSDLLEQLHALVTEDEIEATADIPPALFGDAKRTLGALRDAVNGLAESLDLPPGLLAPRKALEELVGTRSWPQALDGWRRQVLEPYLLPLLN